MNISPIVKLLIGAAWRALSVILSSAGVPMIVISAIEQVLIYFGLLGSKVVSQEEMVVRAHKVMARFSTEEG